MLIANKDYELMNADIQDNMNSLQRSHMENLRLNAVMVDMCLERVKELYPKSEVFFNDFSICRDMDEVMEIINSAPDWVPKFWVREASVIAFVKMQKNVCLCVGLTYANMNPTVIIRLVKKFYNANQNGFPGYGIPVDFTDIGHMTVSPCSGSNLSLPINVDTGFINEMMTLYKSMAMIPEYAKQFGIIENVDTKKDWTDRGLYDGLK